MSETPNPNFLQEIEKKADAFFEHMKEEVNHVIHPDADPVAAAAAQIAAQGAESLPNAAPATESATAPAIGDQAASTHVQIDPPVVLLNTAEDPNAGASHAVESSTSDTSSSAPTAPSSATELPSAESSAAIEPPASLTFEQMVEARFLKLEAALVQLPKSIHAVTSAGSLETEDFGKAVLAHVFAHI